MRDDLTAQQAEDVAERMAHTFAKLLKNEPNRAGEMREIAQILGEPEFAREEIQLMDELIVMFVRSIIEAKQHEAVLQVLVRRYEGNDTLGYKEILTQLGIDVTKLKDGKGESVSDGSKNELQNNYRHFGLGEG